MESSNFNFSVIDEDDYFMSHSVIEQNYNDSVLVDWSNLYPKTTKLSSRMTGTEDDNNLRSLEFMVTVLGVSMLLLTCGSAWYVFLTNRYAQAIAQAAVMSKESMNKGRDNINDEDLVISDIYSTSNDIEFQLDFGQIPASRSTDTLNFWGIYPWMSAIAPCPDTESSQSSQDDSNSSNDSFSDTPVDVIIAGGTRDYGEQNYV